MQIYEEYLKRHSIGVSPVKHVSLGYLFFRESSDIGFQWTVLSIFWNEPDRSPGNYSIRFSTPIHDSRSAEMDLLRLDKRLSWDEYEEFFYDWALNCNKNKIISGQKQITLTAWEMFVFSHDTYFARTYKNMSDLFFESLDFNLSVENRFSSYQKIIKSFDEKLNPFKSWKSEINSYSKHYCHWLVDLIQK